MLALAILQSAVEKKLINKRAPKINGRCWPLQQKSILEWQQLSISYIGLNTSV